MVQSNDDVEQDIFKENIFQLQFEKLEGMPSEINEESNENESQYNDILKNY